jgi:hypothetical protein
MALIAGASGEICMFFLVLCPRLRSFSFQQEGEAIGGADFQVFTNTEQGGFSSLYPKMKYFLCI